jgi:aldose 1-epimerase
MSAMPPFETVTLRSGTARLEVAPALGGTILAYWSETTAGRVDWLTPRATTPMTGYEALGLGSFPLVPYSNRIRDGRFSFGGHDVVEPLRAGTAISIHGHGRSSAWQVVEAQADRLRIAYEHPPGGWPWRYRAHQEFRLSEDRLEVTIGLENRSGEEMPAGLGHHPYFPLSPEARVTAAIGAIWWPETPLLPTERRPPPPEMDPNRGVFVGRVHVDHLFAGWDGRAVIEWPDRGRRLVLTGDRNFGSLVVFSPPEKDFFCVEPVSHCVDAFNLAPAGIPDTGMRVLKPGDAWQATMTLAPESF